LTTGLSGENDNPGCSEMKKAQFRAYDKMGAEALQESISIQESSEKAEGTDHF